MPVTRKEPIKDPKGKVVAEKEIVEYYLGYKDKEHKEIVGYAIEAFGKGYSSVIETMVGVNKDGTIRKVKILSQKETPGLGARCIEDEPFKPQKPKWTTEQFIGKTVDQLKVDKDGGPIVSITGATISSRAITNSIREALQNFLKKMPSDSTQMVKNTENENGGE